MTINGGNEGKLLKKCYCYAKIYNIQEITYDF